MSNSCFLHVQDKLKNKLTPKRYEHTLGVQYISAALAMRYKADIVKAQTAGLLHDCARCFSDEKTFSLCIEYNIKADDFGENNSKLLHATLGAYVAEHKYDIKDKEILNAIKYHTTGRPNMTLLEKIIYVADYIEPGRKLIPNLDIIREMAFDNINMTVTRILKNTIMYLDELNSYIDPMSMKAYNYYKHQ